MVTHSLLEVPLLGLDECSGVASERSEYLLQLQRHIETLLVENCLTIMEHYPNPTKELIGTKL